MTGKRRQAEHRAPARLAVVAGIACLVTLAAAVASAGAMRSAKTRVKSAGVASVTGDLRADSLLARMTLADKLSLLEGAEAPAGPGGPDGPGTLDGPGTPGAPDGPGTPSAASQHRVAQASGISRLGISPLRFASGPPPVVAGLTYPPMMAPLGVAATFSRGDAYANGLVIGRNAHAAGLNVVPVPVADIARDPAAGGAMLTFGEDPLLAGQAAAAEITGIQDQGTMAMAGHYVADTTTGNVVVDEQTLHEIYLAPFAAAVRARVAAIMCSSAALRVVATIPAGPETPGADSCDNAGTLTGILRNELGFPGFIASDRGVNHSTLSLASGLNMELPSAAPGGMAVPAFSAAAVRAAIASGSLQPSTINQAAGRILAEMDRFGLLGPAPERPVTPEPAAAAQQVAQITAQDAATLLKDDGHALPLSAGERSSLALIGPGAGPITPSDYATPPDSATPSGPATPSGLAAPSGLPTSGTSATSPAGPARPAAGNSSGPAWQAGSVQALRQDLSGDPGAHLSYAAGDELTGVPVPASALSHNGQPGLVRTAAGSGAARGVSTLDNTVANGHALPAGSGHTWSGELTVPVTGTYGISLGLLGAGGSISLDGRTVAGTGSANGLAAADGSTWPGGSLLLPTTDGLGNLRTQLTLSAGSHTLTVTQVPDASGRPVQIRLDWLTPAQQQANLNAAIAAARNAKAAVVFAESTASLGSPLPAGQDQLIEGVAAANPDTIVVLDTPGPVAMPWLSRVKAVLEMWYPGAPGAATANVLLGRADPAGRLPVTWPAAADQGVASEQGIHPERATDGVGPAGRPCSHRAGLPGSGPACTTTYSEGIFVGYRWYDEQRLTPMFPFGYGLSYTSFAYSGLRWSQAPGGGLLVTFHVTNTGPVAGEEVPQVYLGAPASPPPGAAFAAKALAAYTRISLRPGQSQVVTLRVPLRQLRYWDDARGWVTATGMRPLYVGGNERTDDLSTTVNVAG